MFYFGDDKSKEYSFVGYRNYLSSNIKSICVVLFFLLLSFGQKLFSNTFSIDTQSIIQVPDSLYGSWFELNRFMLVGFKRITGTIWYNNALASFLMVILFWIAVTVWGYLMSTASTDAKVNAIYFMVPLVVSPIMAEQLGFLLQAPEICVGLIAIAVALMLLQKVQNSNCFLYFILAVLITAFAFSLYAAMVTIFITAVAMLFILKYREQCRFKSFMANFICVNAAVCILAYMVYVIANRLFLFAMHLHTNPYINEQSRWGKDSLKTIASSIFLQMYKMYTGKGIYYSIIFTVLIILSLLILSYYVLCKELSFIYFIVYLMVCVSPMLMPVLLGGTASIRTEISYALAFAFLVMFVAAELSRVHIKNILTIVMLVIIGFTQGCITNRIFYTESVVYSQDVELANSIANRVGLVAEKEIPDVPVVFVGSHATRCNNDCYSADQLELVGRSMFEITFSTSHGTWVKNQFMGVQGFQYKFPSSSQMSEAEEKAKQMPQWPAEGSVSMDDGYIIVKF